MTRTNYIFIFVALCCSASSLLQAGFRDWSNERVANKAERFLYFLETPNDYTPEKFLKRDLKTAKWYINAMEYRLRRRFLSKEHTEKFRELLPKLVAAAKARETVLSKLDAKRAEKTSGNMRNLYHLNAGLGAAANAAYIGNSIGRQL